MRWFLFFLLLMPLACATTSEPAWVEGGLYSTPGEDGSYAVVKILKLDDLGVHVRVYSNRFDAQPSEIDESMLYMAGIDHGPDEQLGMGHLPLSKASFAEWQPHFIQLSTVSEAELEGYRMWEETSGGYF